MVDLSIGQICNNSCIMCTTIRSKDRSAKQLMVPLEELKKMIDSLKEPEYIAITGGEPTIRDDLFEIIKYIKNKFPKTETKLLTNARMLSYTKYCERLAQSGLDTFIIPIHAHEPGLHDFITRSRGSFDQTMQGIGNISQFNIHLEIRVVVHGLNYPFLPETAELIKKETERASVVFLYFDIIGSAYLNKERLIVPMTTVAPYLETAADTLKDRNTGIYHFPLCILKKKYRNIAKGRTVEDRRIIFVAECERCKKKDDCCGIWKTYNKMQGDSEFYAIK